MSRKRRRYTDEFRASAVLMLEAAGYPNRPGVSTATAKHLGIPESTLRSWYNAHMRNGEKPARNEPPANLYKEKKDSLRELFEREMRAILGDMPNSRQDAAYRDMGWVLGVLFDKLQLIDSRPTAIVKLQEAVESGTITHEQVKERYPSLAEELFQDVS